MPSPGRSLSLNFHTFTNPEALQSLPFGAFNQDHDWFNLQALSPPQRRSGSRNENSNLLNTGWIFWQPVPTLRWDPKVTSLTYKKHLFCQGHHLGKSNGLGNYGRKLNIYVKYILIIYMTKYIFLTKSQ